MASKLSLKGLVRLLFATTLSLGAALDSGAQESLLSRTVPSFDSLNEPAVSAILRFGREADIPIGIVLNKRLCSAKFEELRIDHVPAKTALDQLSSALPAVNWSLEHGTVVFAAVDAPAAMAQFLSLAVNPYRVPEDTLQAQAAYEWLNIRASLRPNEGTAFSVLSSTEARKWPALNLGSTTVRETLDRLVGRNPGGAWILAPIKDIEKAAENRPFQLIDYSSPTDVTSLCADQLDSGDRPRATPMNSPK